MSCNTNPGTLVGHGRAKRLRRAFRRAVGDLIGKGNGHCRGGGNTCAFPGKCTYVLQSATFEYSAETAADGVVYQVTATGTGECRCVP